MPAVDGLSFDVRAPSCGQDDVYCFSVYGTGIQFVIGLTRTQAEFIHRKFSKALNDVAAVKEQGEVLEISRVLPPYARKFSDLELQFTTMPKTAFIPGMKVQIIPVTDK